MELTEMRPDFDVENDLEVIASEFAWKGKVLTGEIKAAVSPGAIDKVRHTLSSKLNDDATSLSLMEIATRRYKTVLCKPLAHHTRPEVALSKRARLQTFLEQVLQLLTMFEVKTKQIMVPTHQLVHDILSTTTLVPFVCDIALDSVEVVEVSIPGNRWAITHVIAANVVQVGAFRHHVRLRNTRTGHVAAIQRLLHQSSPSLWHAGEPMFSLNQGQEVQSTQELSASHQTHLSGQVHALKRGPAKGTDKME
ncbi:hypothetical protein H310_14951 [Aphanomyces invadans]|uniref:Uncharacterized protein n=1 Tax=Aphanomyces invadans TaxID=157072 RepID=A0A024T9B4_9STRA|nr:hypothetical protein H310_14951 [Aphanomyces invadans]ETV90216.1 hypothetical protein H310_14951 [Aphanomyces invadans]|eukprot:XP_008881153.1 hypothetical protein H310_14951 [Aphanomyces invadans]